MKMINVPRHELEAHASVYRSIADECTTKAKEPRVDTNMQGWYEGRAGAYRLAADFLDRLLNEADEREADPSLTPEDQEASAV